MVLRSLIASALCSSVAVHAYANETGPTEPEQFAVMRGRAVGLECVRREPNHPDFEIELQLHIEQHYGYEVLRFMSPDRKGQSIRNIRTSWDATPIHEWGESPWCERLEAILPPGIRMGERWIIVVGWRREPFRYETLKIEPFTPEAEERITTEYRDDIRALERRSAGNVTSATRSKMGTLRSYLQGMQEIVRQAGPKLRQQYETELLPTFREKRQTVEQSYAWVEARTHPWIDHLRKRLAAIDPEDDAERQHVQDMIDTAKAALDEVREMRDEILAMELVNE